MQADLAITIVTPEAAPLAVFRASASQDVAELLAHRGIEVMTSAYCEIPQAKTIRIHPGDMTLEVDRIVALAELRGPEITGLPHDPAGFIPIDDHGSVRGAERVRAAGDATDFAVKHGGIAAQQADVAAQSIAAMAAAEIEPQPLEPIVEGFLLTGDTPMHQRSDISSGQGSPSALTEMCAGARTAKISAPYLTPQPLQSVSARA